MTPSPSSGSSSGSSSGPSGPGRASSVPASASRPASRLRLKQGHLGIEESGKGPPVLFLHGVGSDKSAWRPQLDGLSDSFRCVAVDYPGYGDSSPAPAGTDRAGLARILLEAVQALGEARAHVVGLSMGGVMALEMARLAPQSILSLTLADSFAFHPDGADIDDRFQKALRSKPMPEFAASRAPALVAPACPPALVADIQAVLGSIPMQSVAWASPLVWRADARDVLKGLRIPTLVLVGAEDRITPPDLSLELAQGIPRARLGVIGGAGHLSNLEKPTEFNRLLREFLEGL
jgi:3-oxoadipate enol-lactonase